MAPAQQSPPDDDLDDLLDMRSKSADTSRSARRRAREGRSAPREGVRAWAGDLDDEKATDNEVVDDELDKPRRDRPPIYWRARDSLFFEPLVALAIIVLLLVSLYAYTSNWPPVYVVESNSMQHGAGDHLGVINAGDIVLAQKASLGSIITYIDAIRTGFSTYGSLGDVLIYEPNGSGAATPIIHRAILYLEYDSSNSTYTAVGLAGLSCGSGGDHVYYSPDTPGGCGTSGLSVIDTLDLYNIGGRTVAIDFSRTSDLGDHSGFLTLGDNNSYADQLPANDGPIPLSTLVEAGWVVGVARGMIPWFGAVKLLLDGNAGKVPTASWEYLGLTVAGAIFAAAGIHLLLRRRHEAVRKRRPREETDEDEEEAEPAPKSKRSSRGVRAWTPAAEPPAEADGATSRAPSRNAYEARRRRHFVSSREDRPWRRHNKEHASAEDREPPEPNP